MLPGMALGFPQGPQDLLLEDDGTPIRIDKAFTWDAPLAAHGMMHMVIANAWAGDPYKIDTLFMYMANMAWNSSMNPGESMRMLTDKDPATGAISHSARDLCRRVLLGNRAVRGSDSAGYDLSRALGLHFDAGPADRRPGRVPPTRSASRC